MAKRGCFILLFCSCFFIGFPCCSYAEKLFSLRQGQQLRDWEHLLSPNGGIFKLGFFNPSSSSNRYLGIWYSKLPNNPEAVWVANPYDPILDSSGVLTLDSDGKLRITHSGGQPIVLNSNQAVLNNVTANLLETGNFVLRELNSDETAGQVLWQSFDYPTNTLLPGMKLGMNFRTGHNWTLSSWLSDQVPAPGAFRLGVDPGGVNRLIVWRRGDVYWSSGDWKNGNFQMAPELKGRIHQYEFSFVSNEKEKYFSYSVRNNSTLSRWEVNDWGQILEFNLAVDGTTWQYAASSPCKIKVNYPNAVCIEQKPSECRNGSELFVPTRGFFNDSELLHDDYNTSLALSDCHCACWNNCSCVAYRSYFPNGTGCEFWSKGANFVENDNFEVLYVLAIGNSFEGKKTDTKVNILNWWWIRSLIIIPPSALAILFSFYLCHKRRKKLQQLQQAGESETSKYKTLPELRSQIIPFYKFSNLYKLKGGKKKGREVQSFSFAQIVDATDNFSVVNKLGEGGFGPVYKVILDGQQVAVKRLAGNSRQGLEEFMNEITLIAELQHTNLVKLLGCCVQGAEKMLIYEYMPNKSLNSFLFDPAKRILLDWKTRIGIIEGIAQGLLYLHKYSRVRIIHRDLKASNVLLDDDMNPKISDFGMARIFGQNESRANTNKVVGTYGYMSPEYAMRGIFSVKSDVFSFGVLLLEIVSGKKNTNYSPASSLSLIEHAWNFWKEDDCLQLMDTSLDSSCPKNELVRCIQVGLLCVQERAVDRPTMSDIISMLTNETTFLPDPKQPAYYVGRSEIGATLPNGKSDICSVNSVSISVMEAR